MEILIKVQVDHFIDDMFNNEYLYFSHIENFRNKMNIKFSERDDRNEGVAKISQSVITKIINKETKNVIFDSKEGLKGQLREYYNLNLINICSLYRAELTKNYTTINVSDKLLKFGNKAIVILFPNEFERILDKSLYINGFNYKRGPVEYYDPKTFNGKLTLHDKEALYKHQNEYRIVLNTNSKGDIKLPLKGLKKISCVIKTEELIQGIKIQF